MEFIEISSAEKKSLLALNEVYRHYIEQKDEEQEFLAACVSRKTPLKVLEVGVSSGSSSVIILNAIKDNPNAHLYSIDYLTPWYKDHSKLTGFVMDSYPKLKEQWTLFTGGVAAKFMEEIGQGIDLVFIDTAHSLPGEALDFLMILPYLKKDALLILHDTNHHTSVNAQSIVNNLLMSSIVGKKIIPSYAERFFAIQKDIGFSDLENLPSDNVFPNIGAIELNKNTRDNIWNVFNLLSLPWSYLPSDEDFLVMKNSFKKHYDEFHSNMFETSFKWAQYLQNRVQDRMLFMHSKKVRLKTLYRYKLYSIVTWGKTREYYQERYNTLKQARKRYASESLC